MSTTYWGVARLSSGDDTDWEAHFFKVRNWFIGTICVISIIAVMASYYLNNVPLTHPYRVNQAIVTVTAIMGFFTRSTSAHIWIGFLYLAISVLGQAIFRLYPALSS